MKSTLLSLTLLAAFAAHATKPAPEPKTPTPTTPAGSTATAGAAAAAQARSSARVRTSTASSASVAPGAVVASQTGGDQSMHVERSAPSVYGTATPPSPTTCDGSGFSIGGSGLKGGGLFNLPTGERESCLGAQDIATMRSAGFTMDDIQRRACMVSTIAKTPTCKRFAEQDAPSAQAEPAAALSSYRDPNLLP